MDSGSSVNIVSAKFITDLLPNVLSPESSRAHAPCFAEVVDLKGNKARRIDFLDLFYSLVNGIPSFNLNKEGGAVELTLMIVDSEFD
jgi:hypothetical protein